MVRQRLRAVRLDLVNLETRGPGLLCVQKACPSPSNIYCKQRVMSIDQLEWQSDNLPTSPARLTFTQLLFAEQT